MIERPVSTFHNHDSDETARRRTYILYEDALYETESALATVLAWVPRLVDALNRQETVTISWEEGLDLDE